MALSFAEEFELFEARETLARAKAYMDWYKQPPKSWWENMGGSGCDFPPMPMNVEWVHAAEQTVIRLELKEKQP